MHATRTHGEAGGSYRVRQLDYDEMRTSARREYMTNDGQVVHGGSDHYVRLAATKHVRDFVAAGRPAPKRPEKRERRGLTLQESRGRVKF